MAWAESSRDHCNCGSRVEPAPAVAGGSIPQLTPSLPDLARLFLSLPVSLAQRDVAMGSLFTAAGVTGAGVLPGPAALVTSASPVACSSVRVPAPGVMPPADAASVTGSVGRHERARESSRSERRRRHSSDRERSHSGGKRGQGRSPSPAYSARSVCASDFSSSESSNAKERVSAMPPPPAGRPGVSGGRSKSDRSASDHDHSPQLAPSGLGSGSRSATGADRSLSEYGGRSFPTPSGAAEEDRSSTFDLVDLDRDDLFRVVLRLIQEFHSMEEPASVAPKWCKTSLAPVYWLQSESSPALHLPLSPLLRSLLEDTNSALPSSWKTRLSTGFSLFPVVAIGGTTGLPPPLFLVCIRSRPC